MANIHLLIFALLVVCAAKSGHFAAAEVDALKVLGAMYQGADLEEQPIQPQDKEIIKYWVDVMKDTQQGGNAASKCSVDYLSK